MLLVTPRETNRRIDRYTNTQTEMETQKEVKDV